MNIKKHQILSEFETLDRLQCNTRLRGFDKPFVYRHADLSIVEQADISTIVPPQRYVLSGTVQDILALADAFEKRDVDVFALKGALLFWTEEMDEWGEPIPFLPPIVEDSVERNDQQVRLLNDGMHRVYTARSVGRRINYIYVKGVPPEYPYYAYGFTGGWDGVKVFAELPDEFQKKDYRNPENYKALFRDFNAVFPGIQKDRKQSNPSHIKQ